MDRIEAGADLWSRTGLSPTALDRLDHRGPRAVLPSSFAVTEAAAALVGAVSLAIDEVAALRSGAAGRKTSVDSVHSALSFQSERHLAYEGDAPELGDGFAGYYETADGWIQFHTIFPHHRDAMLAALDLPPDTNREGVAAATIGWNRFDLEERVSTHGGVAAALRTSEEWSAHPHSRAPSTASPLLMRHEPGRSVGLGASSPGRPLSGLRVLDLTRIIAGPVASRTLAAFGADVLRVGSAGVPVVEYLLGDTTLGKRFCHLDFEIADDRDKALALATDADVVVSGFRPGALGRFGLGAEDFFDANPDLVVAELSAFGTDGPWGPRRGFDSIVQSATGVVLAETEARGSDSPTPLPCQALDHGSGHLLALGALAGLVHRHNEGGGTHVAVSLLGTRNWLETLDRRDDLDVVAPSEETVDSYRERRDSPWGPIRHLRHGDPTEGVPAEWTIGPARGGSSPPEWLPR